MSAIYDAYGYRVYAYALRHCGPDEADDVVSETFAIAWRRREHLPDQPLGWLVVTARNVISSRRRSERKRAKLSDVLAHHLGSDDPAAEEAVLRREEVLVALDALSDREREALLLVAWDGLDTAGAAEVARCSPRAFRARLMRARARLAAGMLPADDDPGPEKTPRLTPAHSVKRNPRGMANEHRSASA